MTRFINHDAVPMVEMDAQDRATLLRAAEDLDRLARLQYDWSGQYRYGEAAEIVNRANVVRRIAKAGDPDSGPTVVLNTQSDSTPNAPDLTEVVGPEWPDYHRHPWVGLFARIRLLRGYPNYYEGKIVDAVRNDDYYTTALVIEPAYGRRYYISLPETYELKRDSESLWFLEIEPEEPEEPATPTAQPGHYRDLAVRTLGSYLKNALTPRFTWTPDNDSEMEIIIDSIVAAAVATIKEGEK